ncbi:muconate cycloisomerase 1 [Moniliophthora roreri MCA 2997]|uniref:Muconate cycloisomerase 1 n=1 Tax=Moniliophthora roreri (strain MCA 2997) TaxID=1381753 RepID=V2XLX5_MONRO|nr:muconate cycloisomerase 1 [Moniliophthora roreri MCA 2997]
MEAAQTLFSMNTTVSASKPLHILSGSFRSVSLFLLAFSPLQRTLDLVQTIDAFGPHQYLALNAKKDRAYATSWALPPTLSSWEIDCNDEGNTWKVSHVNSVPITATSSYIILPPPYSHIYSAGGPTGEVHAVDSSTGGFGEKLQQILFIPEDKLEEADKTRAALRYGSHAVEFSTPLGLAFIPVLGTDSIEVYKRDKETGLLTYIYSSKSPRGPSAHDGPRHVKIHPNGRILYCVTEHTNYLDSYLITPTSLEYIASQPIVPESLLPESSRFRGDTLLLTPSTPSHPKPNTIFTTTRGSGNSDKGWISVFRLDDDGKFVSDTVERYETPTSGGKAHAIDLYPKSFVGAESDHEGLWILLTDDSDHAASIEGGGGVRVLEWDGWGTGGIKEVVGWPAPGSSTEDFTKERMQGGSHALWLD